jgi:hypothetical protein
MLILIILIALYLNSFKYSSVKKSPKDDSYETNLNNNVIAQNHNYNDITLDTLKYDSFFKNTNKKKILKKGRYLFAH